MTFRFSSTVLCAVLLLVAPVPAVRAGQQTDARLALARGLAALKRSDPRTARIELLNAIKGDPSLVAARVAQARTLLMLGDGVGAQGELDRALQLGALPGSMRHLLAHAALLQHEPDVAIKEAMAPDADPTELFFRTRIVAQSLQALGKYRDAARTFDQALKLDPKSSALWADIARFRLATGDLAAALSATDQALALAPKSVDALTLRGLMAREQYGLTASLQWFDAALKVNPDYVPAQIEYAATLADLGEASQALSLTRRALMLAPRLPRAYFIQAVIAARAGKYDLARRLLDHTRGELDGQAAVRLLRGVLHLEAGNATLAVGALEPLVEAQPLNIRARLLLARAKYDDGQYSDAEHVLDPIVERVDAGSYALTLSGRIHEALGNRELAAQFLTRAAAMNPSPSQVYRGAGTPAQTVAAANIDPSSAAPNLRYIRALLEAGEEETAVKRAQILAADNPGAPAAFVALGDCLMAAGRYGEAAGAYERAGNMRFDKEVALRLIDSWRRAGEPAKAARMLELFVAQNPMNVEGQRLAASFLLAAGEFDRTLAILRNLSARLGNQDALLMADMARAHLGLAENDEALPFAAHAYGLMPASAVTSDIFGWTLFKAEPGDRRSIELLEKAQALAPAEALVKLHLGQAYAAFGEKEKARTALRVAANTLDFPRRKEALAALKEL